MVDTPRVSASYCFAGDTYLSPNDVVRFASETVCLMGQASKSHTEHICSCTRAVCVVVVLWW